MPNNVSDFYDVLKDIRHEIACLYPDKRVTKLHAADFWDLLTAKSENAYNKGTQGTIWADIGLGKVIPLKLDNLVFETAFNRYDRGIGHRGHRWWFPPIIFSNCNFNDGVLLEYLNFGGRVEFRNCVFHSNLSFDNSIFTGPVYFHKCEFLFDHTSTIFLAKKITFSRAEFYKQMAMVKCLFPESVDFSSTTFKSTSRFSGCIFRKGVEFDNSIFERPVTFVNNIFNNYARFNNSSFLDKTLFYRSTFLCAPEFHGSSLHQDTSFHETSFSSFSNEADLRAYRTLKQKMGTFLAQDEEGFFFSCEQRTKRVVALRSMFYKVCISKLFPYDFFKARTLGKESVLFIVLSFAYDLLAEYGENLYRIFLWWTLQLIVFAFIYLSNIEALSIREGFNLSPYIPISSIEEAFLLSAQTSINPLTVFGSTGIIIITSIKIIIFAFAQAFISISLLALLVISIRRNFRKATE